MIKLALIGKNISHSRSPDIYRKILKKDHSYTLLDYDCAEQIPLVSDLFTNFTGISITSPYKTHFLNQVELLPHVQKLGAINCLYKNDNKIFGANTDYDAIKDLLPNDCLDHVAILGTGAMSKLFQILFQENSISYDLFGRKTHGNLNLLDYTSYTLVINCCGRDFDFTGALESKTLFWDINYSLKHSGKIVNYLDGLKLLELQARYALEYWKLT